jgi:hypothetical protein
VASLRVALLAASDVRANSTFIVGSSLIGIDGI